MKKLEFDNYLKEFNKLNKLFDGDDVYNTYSEIAINILAYGSIVRWAQMNHYTNRT